ncbi:hypothetical protein DFR58_13038 [Anaerobacterium chartisolvens]|uniref:YGGT family protein n=1 Tax=Anaerobacterium chartisolvens TaxID=1297424 RepID=A0A369ALW4_9FIRM|nr:YggT family protein [Anaerobacterium chartisolvens]RCX10372.1 hypothetical protein DFR58_13038 [Anaerobacterium chartisolvens]
MDYKDNKDKKQSQEEIHPSLRSGTHDSRKIPVWFIQTRNIIYYVLGIIEILLGFRLVFKLLGASTKSSFVTFLYSSSQALISPFTGIFGTFTGDGAGPFVLEPSTIVAMIVYAVAAQGLISLFKIKAVSDIH